MIMETLLTFLLGAITGLVVVWLYLQWLGNKIIQRIQQDIQTQSADKDEEVIEARVELIKDTFYIYRIDNGEFVGQGQTLDELKTRILEKFKNSNKNVKITEGDVDVLKKLKEQA